MHMEMTQTMNRGPCVFSMTLDRRRPLNESMMVGLACDPGGESRRGVNKVT